MKSSHTSILEGSRSAAVSDIGRVRGENQDAILSDDRLGLWLVADGMGGHAGGARASEIARDTVYERIKAGSNLADAVIAAHWAIRTDQVDHPDRGDMGTTIVAAHERNRTCQICWVGDSRVYGYSTESGRLELLTDDHNVAGMLVASGALSPAEAARHPQRHVLTDCLGLSGDDEPRVGLLEKQWQPGDVLLLCSDGLSGEIDDEEIRSVLAQQADLEAAASHLLDRALGAGARDNVSLVLVAAPVTETRSGRWKWPFGRRRG